MWMRFWASGGTATEATVTSEGIRVGRESTTRCNHLDVDVFNFPA